MKSILNKPLPALPLPDSKEQGSTIAQATRKASINWDAEKPTISPANPEVWGRHGKATHWDAIYAASVMLFCPIIVILCYTAIHRFDGSVVDAAWSFLDLSDEDELLVWIRENCPMPSKQGFAMYGGWLLFQAALYVGLPGKQCQGQITPAGHLLVYKVNGLRAWIVSITAFVLGSYFGLYRLSVVARTWGPLLIAANVYGYCLTVFAYFKAYLFPTHDRDNKYSGSWIYDMYMGIEFNPRFTEAFDFKLFHNGRPGIIAWTIINISFTAHQLETHGQVSLGLIGVNLLQLIYVVDFFYNEDWYLRTIDIAHDHFGFYLAWGDSVWLPQMYTLQGQYLSSRPDSLPALITMSIIAFGLAGYWLFRSANHQKDLVRRTGGDCVIWGKKPEVINARYYSKDGEEHTSLLLCSGWWGVVRHANYLGDLIQAFSMCAVCGFQALVPFSYLIFMVILLLHRTSRDNERCSVKYGKYWKRYQSQVKWILIPSVF